MCFEIRAVKGNEYIDNPGVHLINPTELEIENAKRLPENQGVVIWCHYSNVFSFESKRKAA